jgi:spore germination cell wall hydrolase CwlJ-like protein
MKGGLMEKSLKFIFLVIGFFAVYTFVSHLTTTKFQKLEQVNNLYTKEVATVKSRERQLQCLAINIYREAGYEPFEGKVGVAQVTLNRASSGQFPNDICQVVYQKNVVMEKVVCQFSWACDRVHQSRPINQHAYAESYEVAKKVLLEGFRLPSLREAMYYHAVYVNPRWQLEKISKIGNHIFYKAKGT